MIGGVGDVNGLDGSELAFFAPSQTNLSVIYGQELTPITTNDTGGFGMDDDGSDDAPVQRATSTLLTRSWQPELSSYESAAIDGIDILNPTDVSLNNALSITGSDVVKGLGGLRSIGDVNADGFVDMAIEAGESNFLLFGPFDTTASTLIDQLTSVLFWEQDSAPGTSLIEIQGRPIEGSGDVNGDGIDDLVLATDSPDGRTVLTYFSGGTQLPHQVLVGQASGSSFVTSVGQDADFRSRAQFLNFDGIGSDEVVISIDNLRDNRLARIISLDGSRPTTTLTASLTDGSIVPPPNHSLYGDDPWETNPSLETKFEVNVIGDINGDGRDDIAVSSPNLFREFGSNFDPEPPENSGAVYFVLGGVSGTVSVPVAARQMTIVTGGAERVVSLGDLDEDGFDEFAIHRSIEGSHTIAGKALIYRGGIVWNSQAAIPDQPWLTISQGGVPAGLAFDGDGRFMIATGDLDNDGRPDLVVGRPAANTVSIRNVRQTLLTREQGDTTIFFDVQSKALLAGGNLLTLAEGDRVYRGTSLNELSGTLVASLLADFDGDGVDDLWIGSPGADGGIGKSRLIPGRTHLPLPLPDASSITPLENRLGFLVDDESGIPIRFSGSGDPTQPNDFRLAADQGTAWYQFTLAGDGLATPLGSDHIRVDQGELVPSVRLDLIGPDGTVLVASQTRVDLRNAVAGTYRLRVSRADDVDESVTIDFALEVDAPAIGQSHTPSDRDKIIGGSGQDTLVGGRDRDALIGGAGDDRFIVESAFEAEDARVFNEMRNESILTRFEEAVLTETDQIVSPRAVANPLRRAIAFQLGHPVTENEMGEVILHRPWYASELAQIESIDLSGLGLTDTTGLELLPNLRFVDLSDNALTRIPTNLPNVHTLNLDDNQIRDLSSLAAIQVVDQDDFGYVETRGDWQSELAANEPSWEGNYRFSKDGGSVTWSFDVEAGTEFDLFATWPVLTIDDPQDVTFTISGIEGGERVISVGQTFVPGAAAALAGKNVLFGGVPWESLGRVIADGKSITVTLTGVDGQTLAADTVRAQPVSPPKLNLRTLSLLGNPINDHSREENLPSVLGVNPALQVALDEPGTPPVIGPLPPVNEVNASLSFANQVAVLPLDVLYGVSSFLVEFWYRMDRFDNRAVLSAAGDNGSNEFLIQFVESTTGVENAIRVGQRNETGRDFRLPTGLGTGTWHHYAIQRDVENQQIRVFVDGQALPRIDSLDFGDTGNLEVSRTGLVLGQEQDEVSGNYDTNQAAYGQLDELRFWDPFWQNTNLTVEQHLAINRNRQVDGDDPNLRAYYRFDETHPDVIFDSSSAGLHGRLGDETGTEARDRRGRPTRATNAPITRETTIDLASAVSQAVGVSFGAVTSHPDVSTRIVGDQLTLEYPADQELGAVRVTVVASAAGGGREIYSGFDFTNLQTSPTDLYRYGSVFVDANNNGIRDASETLVPDAKLYVLGSDGDVVARSSTDASGNYRISLEAYQFRSDLGGVEVVPPSGYTIAPSSNFDRDALVYQYDFDIDPFDASLIDLDRNGAADWRSNRREGNSILAEVSDGMLPLRSGQFVGADNETTTLWPTLLPTVDSGYTVEFSIQIDADLDEGTRGAFAVAPSIRSSNPGGPSINAALFIGKNRVTWLTQDASGNRFDLTLSTADNTDAFHTFQVIQKPGEANEFYVFRDGALLQPDPTPLVGYTFGTFSQDRLWFGDLGSSEQGGSTLDYLRVYKGANGFDGSTPQPTDFTDLPFASATDFAVRRPMDIGADRLVSLGTPQTFVAVLDDEAVTPFWTVTRAGETEVLASGTGTTLTFDAPEVGDYYLGVTDESQLGPSYSEQLLLRVLPTPFEPPAISIDSDPATVEGTPLTFSIDKFDFGFADQASMYQWTATTEAGEVFATTGMQTTADGSISHLDLHPDRRRHL